MVTDLKSIRKPSRKHYAELAEKRGKGRFVSIRADVILSDAWARTSPSGIRLIMDLAAQYRGHNNGDLCAAWGVMRGRGWKSNATLMKARHELEEKRWVIVTRKGKQAGNGKGTTRYRGPLAGVWYLRTKSANRRRVRTRPIGANRTRKEGTRSKTAIRVAPSVTENRTADTGTAAGFLSHRSAITPILARLAVARARSHPRTNNAAAVFDLSRASRTSLTAHPVALPPGRNSP